MVLKLQSISHLGDFRLMKDDIERFELKYSDWFSSDAATQFNGQTIEIRPRNIWNSKFDIFKDNQDCGDIIFNWRGHVIIRLIRLDDGGEDEFLLKHRGILNTRYDLISAQARHILTLTANYNWSKFKYFYSVDNENHDIPDIVLEEFLIYCGFAANLHMSRNGTL